MKLKSDTKFGKVSTHHFKIGIRNMIKFDPTTRKSKKKIHFNGLLLSKVYVVWPKKVQKNNLSWNWRRIQNLESYWLFVSKLASGFLQNLTWALESLKNFHFNELLLKKVYIVLGKIVPRNIFSWNWRGMQNFERNWLVISKLV